jgi:Cu(I)/Ag(I) efflux system membrane fusion protein
LRDRIVILEGLKVGENVATAGNFLIDSQMQLAGKPSLIDPARAIAKSKERKGPLAFEHIAASPIEGETGKSLEQLYEAYVAVQRALAADEVPSAKAAQLLHSSAAQLEKDSRLPETASKLITEVTQHSEHLHHFDLAGARKEFKPISHAVVTLATQVRGDAAKSTLTHFYCPMVKGGGGDWLQADGQLLNPYYGSEMLRCGEKVHEFPPPQSASTEPVGPTTTPEPRPGT